MGRRHTSLHGLLGQICALLDIVGAAIGPKGLDSSCEISGAGQFKPSFSCNLLHVQEGHCRWLSRDQRCHILTWGSGLVTERERFIFKANYFNPQITHVGPYTDHQKQRRILWIACWGSRTPLCGRNTDTTHELSSRQRTADDPQAGSQSFWKLKQDSLRGQQSIRGPFLDHVDFGVCHA